MSQLGSSMRTIHRRILTSTSSTSPHPSLIIITHRMVLAVIYLITFRNINNIIMVVAMVMVIIDTIRNRVILVS